MRMWLKNVSEALMESLIGTSAPSGVSSCISPPVSGVHVEIRDDLVRTYISSCVLVTPGSGQPTLILQNYYSGLPTTQDIFRLQRKGCSRHGRAGI